MENNLNTDTNLIENNQNADNFFDDEEISENIKLNILNLRINENKRLIYLEEYYNLYKNDAIEVISQISGMYQFSGTKILEKYLYNIVFNTNLSLFLKIEASKSLLSFEEFEEDIFEDDDEEFKLIKKESNESIRDRNNKRQILAYETLNHVCSQLENDKELSTTFKVEVICLLMKNKNYYEQSVSYFNKIIDDINLNCDYRYKVILSLENKKLDNFVDFAYSFLLTFLNNKNNQLMYRILSAQYILQNIDKENENVQKILYDISINESNEYNLRADASDTLLTLGNEEYKNKARDIILELGKIGGKVKNIFEDAQNVHSQIIEASVRIILSSLVIVPTMKIDDEEIDITYIENQINELISQHNKTKEQEQNIIISLNRIKMDRTLYFSRTLYKILIKLWSYIETKEYKDELLKRLLEELEDMSGTCSSGFLSRLINTVSGFGEFNVSMSFCDQIIANFCGRINARAMQLYDKECDFYEKNMKNILEIYFNHYKLFENKIIDKDNIEMHTIDDRIALFKKECKFDDVYDKKIDEIKDEFCENVLNEMTIESSNVVKRQCFLLFFRTYMSSIREELYNEFMEYVSDSEFDLAFRKALSNYDGIKDTL